MPIPHLHYTARDEQWRVQLVVAIDNCSPILMITIIIMVIITCRWHTFLLDKEDRCTGCTSSTFSTTAQQKGRAVRLATLIIEAAG